MLSGNKYPVLLSENRVSRSGKTEAVLSVSQGRGVFDPGGQIELSSWARTC